MTPCAWCGKVGRIVNECGCDPNNMPTLATPAARMRAHLAATGGEQTEAAFSRSPYFVRGRGNGPAWWWDETALRTDQAELARAHVSGG